MKHASVDRAKRVDSGCRNNGSCPYCRRSRTMSAQRVDAKPKHRDIFREWGDAIGRLGNAVDEFAARIGPAP